MTQKAGEGVGERISRYRRANKLTAQQLAEAAGEGLTRPIIANLESGRRNDISVRQLMAIAVALGVPPVALIYDVERPFEETDVTLRIGTRRNADGGFDE